MFIKKGSRVLITTFMALAILVLNTLLFKVVFSFNEFNTKSYYVMGGKLYDDTEEYSYNNDKESIKPDDVYIDSLLRPSDNNPIAKKYFFNSEQGIPKTFQLPMDVVRAYYDILSDASNIDSKKEEYANIGLDKQPYPLAYELLSQDVKSNLSLNEFINSFSGIGHINLIKLIEGTINRKDDEEIYNYFVEVETIEKDNTLEKTGFLKTNFCYYYGFASVKQDEDRGWSICNIEIKPENFLHHAYHEWNNEAGAIVKGKYEADKQIIEDILGVEENGYFRYVYAKGKDKRQYRIQFVRVTNGEDIELRQYVLEDDKWKEVYLMK
jgi:hypothetical protein